MAHIFVDAENVNPRLFYVAYPDLCKHYDIRKVDIFSKQRVLPNMYVKNKLNIMEFNFCTNGKDSADIMMSVSIVKALYEENTDVFIILTRDADINYAVKALTDKHKTVLIVLEERNFINAFKAVGVDMNFVVKQEYRITRGNPPIKAVSTFGIKDKYKCHLVGYDLSHTMYIKNGKNEIIEIPFQNGMSYSKFNIYFPAKKVREGFPKSWTLTKILYNNFIKIVDGRMYYDTDRLDVKPSSILAKHE